MNDGNKIYEQNIKPLFFLLCAIDKVLTEQDISLLLEKITELREKYEIDHCYGRGSGNEWQKICDIMGLQLLNPDEKRDKGAQHFDKRHENFKHFLRRILNR